MQQANGFLLSPFSSPLLSFPPSVFFSFPSVSIVPTHTRSVPSKAPHGEDEGETRPRFSPHRLALTGLPRPSILPRFAVVNHLLLLTKIPLFLILSKKKVMADFHSHLAATATATTSVSLQLRVMKIASSPVYAIRTSRPSRHKL